MLLKLITLLLLFSSSLFAQVNPAARFSGMGNTGTALGGVAALTSNPAGVTCLAKPQAGLYYQEHLLNADIRTKGGLVVLPTKYGVFGTHLSSYGITGVYGDFKLGMTYARLFGRDFSTSLTFNYHQLRIDKYGGSEAYSVDLGVQYFITECWLVGAHWANLGRTAYDRRANTTIPTHLRFGSSYNVHKNLLVTADIEQIRSTKGIDARSGLEYKPIAWLCFRGGVSMRDLKRFCGFGVFYNNLLLDMATIIHPRLGLSPQMFLAYAF
jgi:hypothetical protein